jgi:ubiquinone/menaquinone biosynthesis C-methylase UbiE
MGGKMGREEIVKGFYAKYVEDDRLSSTRQGQTEYIVTDHYIHEALSEFGKHAKIIEIGAGTGRVSIPLAQEGFDVTAVEYSDSNFEVLRDKCKEIPNIEAVHGDAIDLSGIPDDTYDVTLLFGPMYHLYSKEEQLKALSEAKRITKPHGRILIAYLSIHAIMYTNYINALCGSFKDGFKENFDPEDFSVRHFPEQLFTGFDVEEFEELLEESKLRLIKTVAQDGMLELAQRCDSFQMDDYNFDAFIKYHMAYCEKRELLGLSSHLLAICDR